MLRHRIFATALMLLAMGMTARATGRELSAQPSQSQSSPTPGFRTGAVMAYDAERGHVVLFGGVRQSATGADYPNDLWAWDGTRWHELEPPPGSPRPLGRDASQLVYDPAQKRVVVFGGRREVVRGDVRWLSDQWEWNGVAWHEVLAPGLPNVLHPTAVFDPRRQQLLQYGGGSMDSAGRFAGLSRRLWAFSGGRWQLTDSSGPGNGHPGASSVTTSGTLIVLASEPSTQRSAAPPASRTWTWDGSRWTEQERGPAFANLQPTASAPDGTLYMYQSWEDWLTNGITHRRRPSGNWEQVQTAITPGVRYTIAAAWDDRRHRLVLYGGRTRDGQMLDDTWEFDGTQWQKR